MKCTTYCILAALSAFGWWGIALAETEAEYANRPPASVSASPRPQSDRVVEQAKPKPRPAARPALFAPAAAALAKRLTAEQLEERRFLKDAAASSRFEAEAARLALGKSSNPGVRSLAATLINHHAGTGNELLHMLHERGMAAPMLANDQRRILNRLSRLEGTKFDREFLEEVALRYQQNDVLQYEKASFVAREPRLKAWIDRTLPTVRYQLATAERLAPAGPRLARAVPVSQAGNRFVSRASLATRSMGSGAGSGAGIESGTQTGGMQFAEPMQLGVTRPVAARPTESSTR